MMPVVAAPSSAFTGIIIGLVSSFGSIILIALVVFVFWASGCAGSGRILLDRLGRPGEYDDEQAFAREESDALETMDEMARTEYLRAKAFVTANPPESLQTDISLSQYLAIQEKGVSAWEFEPELEIANCFVEARTEIEFYDSECTVMCNLPVPKQNDVYYWEAKIYDKPENTLLAIGMATKPYPLFRLPGYHKYSVAYHSDGSRHYNQPFSRTPYGPHLVQGDVVGVGYRPRTGVIFFTRNGKRLDEVVHGLKSQNFFPAVGATGPALVHVNLGQSGFVFIEANVKKWGLAPVTGSLAPPPPYGSEQGSILLETGTKDGVAPGQGGPHNAASISVSSPYSVQHRVGNLALYQQHQLHAPHHPQPYPQPHPQPHPHHLLQQHTRTRSGSYRVLPPTSPGPARSPTDISLAQLVPSDDNGQGSNMAGNTATVAAVPPQYHHQQQVLPPDHHYIHHHQPVDNSLHLHLEDATNPPPEYASPTHSDDEDRRRPATHDQQRPLIDASNRRRSDSTDTVIPPPRHRLSSPVPSYNDAVRRDASL